MIQVPRKIFSITELFQNLPNVIPQIHSPSIQMLPIVCAYFTHKQFREQRELALCEKWKYWWQLLLSGEAINNEKTVFEIVIKFAKWICANDPSVPKNFVQRLQGYFKFWQTIFEGPCIQILPIVCTYFSCNSKNKENSHCVRNGSIGDLCYCQAINEKIVRMFKNIDE